MRTARLLWMAVVAGPMWGAYTWSVSDALTSINSSQWIQAGSVTATSGGLTAPDANGGSLISASSLGANYEVRATLTLTANGGTYTLFARATTDARTGGSGTGTFVALEMQNPTFDAGGNCAANFVLYQRSGGTTSAITSFVHSCRNNMVMRLVVRPSFTLIYVDQTIPYIYGDLGIASGQAGVGAYGTPTGNAIKLTQIGLADLTAPGAVNVQSVGVSVFATHIDLQWQGVTDGANGIGMMTYYLYRDGAYLGATVEPNYSDEAVSASQGSHVYSIYPVDQHFNFGLVRGIRGSGVVVSAGID